jgi:hypothetical protein
MPILGDDPATVFADYETHISGVVHSVLPLPPAVGLRVRPTADKHRASLGFYRGNLLTAVPIATDVGMLYLSIAQNMSAEPVWRPRPIRKYRLKNRVVRLPHPGIG